MHTGDQSKPEKEKGEYQEKYGETETNKTKFVKLQAPYFDTQKGFHLPVFTVLEKRISGKERVGRYSILGNSLGRERIQGVGSITQYRDSQRFRPIFYVPPFPPRCPFFVQTKNTGKGGK